MVANVCSDVGEVVSLLLAREISPVRAKELLRE